VVKSPLDEQIARLQAMSTSPHAPEPPARSLAVEIIMRVVTRTGVRLETPHLHGGTDAEKVAYEYRFADSFWEVLRGVAGPEALTGKRVLDVGADGAGRTFSTPRRWVSPASWDLIYRASTSRR
jgi:hypothetical protein